MKKEKTNEANLDAPLSEAEISILMAEQEKEKDLRGELTPHDTSDRAHLFRFIRKNKLLSVAFLFIVLAFLGGAVGGGILLWQHLSAPTDTQLQKNKEISVLFGEEKAQSIEYDDWVRQDIFYFDLLSFADKMDLTVSGNGKRFCFTAKDGSYLSVENGESYAFINSVRVLMEVKTVSQKKTEPASAIVSQNRCLVPYSFLAEAISDGFSLKLNSKTNTLRIRPILNVTDGKTENAVPTELHFSADLFEKVVFPTDKKNDESKYHYSIDIEPYLASITSEHLVLANKTHALGSDYLPDRLTKLTCATAGGRDYYLCADAANALNAMMAAMTADGITDIYVTSAYRSYAYQENLYEGYVKKHMAQGMSREEAEATASTYSSRPGESEHQTGLCLDFTSKEMGGALNQKFENTDAFTWLSENAWQYGFILRYPKSEEQIDITGYDYEPWHYRFVGRYAATEIHEGNLTLEEYLGQT